MKHATIILTTICLAHFMAYANDTNRMTEAEGFVRQIVQSLLDGGGTVTFPVADRIVAIDNGEALSRENFREAWPQFARGATKKKVTLEQFFRDVDLRIDSPLNNKCLMSNKRVLNVYRYQDGDLYCDASHVKEGIENFIGYNKAFIYIIRKAGGKWTLVGIGG
jgi:hypothetical protein